MQNNIKLYLSGSAHPGNAEAKKELEDKFDNLIK